MANVQIRNVPGKLRQQLKHNVAYLGMSLSDYLLQKPQGIASLPTMREWRDQLNKMPRTHLDISVADFIKEGREGRCLFLAPVPGKQTLAKVLESTDDMGERGGGVEDVRDILHVGMLKAAGYRDLG